jgi:putative Holliday junction resolvase
LKRILAVDPGDVHIGLALSDPSGTIASPLATLTHISRKQDAEKILEFAAEHEAVRIVVGVAYDEEGAIGPQARKAFRMIETLEQVGSLPVIPWDESGSTQDALRLDSRADDLDARAAAIFLQDYLDATRN